MRIGIAGYMGAGKTIAAQFLADTFGWDVVDADKLARQIMITDSTIIESVGKTFNVVQEGAIDFFKLGELIFSDEGNLLELNAIVHPILIEYIKDLTIGNDKPILLDAALLPQWPVSELVDTALWISAPQELRVERLIERTSFTEAVLRERCLMQESVLPVPQGSNWIEIENSATQKEFEEKLTTWGKSFDHTS